MFEKTLSKTTKRSLALLAQKRVLGNAYLAGGTGLALQVGHRRSDDLDFFIPENFNSDILTQKLEISLPSFRLTRKDWGSILGRIGKIRFSLFFYKYPLLFRTRSFGKIAIADIKDISAMKIAAISGRGTKKDFIDLYFILAKEKIVNLGQALKLYDRKFKTFKQDKLHIIKSLVFFGDADRDDMPKMLVKTDWKEVKSFFIKTIKEDYGF